MKKLTLFATKAAYNSAKGGLGYPNVSYCKDNNLYYEPIAPAPTHDYVEIGGVKWATMNLGATGVTDFGLYYQWGDTQGYTADQVGYGEGYKYFESSDYKWYDNETSEFTKYSETDGKTQLDAEDDAATAAWGSPWRIPTPSDFEALGNATTSALTSDYEGTGVSGVVLTDKTDSTKTIFFPYAGEFYEDVVSDYGCGRYHASSIPDVGSWYMNGTDFQESYLVFNFDMHLRSNGYPIRPVYDA